MKTIYYILFSLLFMQPSYGQLLDYENVIKVNDLDLIIDQCIADSLAIAYDSDDNDSSFLLKQQGNGEYEILRKGWMIYQPCYTQAYICVDDTLFNLQNQPVDTIHSIPYPLRYLGTWKGQTLFSDNEQLFFQNGKTIDLRSAVLCEPSSSPDSILLRIGVRQLEVAIEDLYHSDRYQPLPDTTLYRIKHRYSTKGDQAPHITNLDVDIEIPVGQTAADQAVRDWIAPSLLYYAFNSEPNEDEQTATHLRAQDFEELVESNVPRWKANKYIDYISGESYYQLAIRRVMETPAYSTYYLYYASIDKDYLESWISYYITFDKRSCEILDAAQAVSPWWLPKMRSLVLEQLQGLFDAQGESYSREQLWEYLTPIEFPNTIGGEPYVESCSKIRRCDQWAGWTVDRKQPIREGNFPLPHMALLPEGISFSFHAGQIAPYMCGEYLVLLPYASAGKYLLEMFQPQPGWEPRLEQFIEFTTDMKQPYCSTLNNL